MKNFTQHKMILTDLLDTTFDQTVKDIQEGTFEIEVELNYGGWIGNIQGSIWSDGEFDLTDISFYSTMESGNNYHIESHDIPNGDKKFFDTIENKMKDKIGALHEILEEGDWRAEANRDYERDAFRSLVIC